MVSLVEIKADGSASVFSVITCHAKQMQKKKLINMQISAAASFVPTRPIALEIDKKKHTRELDSKTHLLSIST